MLQPTNWGEITFVRREREPGMILSKYLDGHGTESLDMFIK